MFFSRGHVLIPVDDEGKKYALFLPMLCCLHATRYWAEMTWPAPGNSVMGSPQTGRTGVELQVGETA